jgi:hypothetical protein
LLWQGRDVVGSDWSTATPPGEWQRNPAKWPKQTKLGKKHYDVDVLPQKGKKLNRKTFALLRRMNIKVKTYTK